MSKKCHLVGINRRKQFVPKAVKNWLQTANMTPCGALRTSSPSSKTVTTSNIWSWIFLFHFFFVLAAVTHFAPIRFYKQTTLHTETFTQSSFYIFYAQIFLHRDVCTKKTFVHRRLYTQMFLRKEGSIYTQMLCTKMFLRAWIKAHRVCHFFCVEKTCVKTLLCKGFFVEKILCWHRKTCTHRLHRFFYRPTFCTQKL